MHTTSAAAVAAESPEPLLTPPAIGQHWPSQGGIYLGVTPAEAGQPDAHLILAAAASPKTLPWKKAIEWAGGVEADGHADFHLPTRTESALIYANARDKVDASEWHWTSTEYEGNGSFAWYQGFDRGYQGNDRKSYEGRARAVRRLSVQSFNPSDDPRASELNRVTERLSFLLNSARLVLTDEVAIATAARAVDEAEALLAQFRSAGSLA